jgi:hypothetical protein
LSESVSPTEFALGILIIALVIVAGFVYLVPAPITSIPTGGLPKCTVNVSTQAGYSCTSPYDTGPCNWYVSLLGTAPIAKAAVATTVNNVVYKPGDSVVGTTGQDPATFIQSNLIATNAQICLSTQTFVFASSLTSTVSGLQITGGGTGTTIKPASGTFDVMVLDGNDINVHSLTIDTSSMTGGYAIRLGHNTQSNRFHLWNLSVQVGSTTGGIFLDIHSGVGFVYGDRIQSVLAPTGNALQTNGADQHIFENDIGGFGGGATIECSQCTDVSIDGNQLYVGFFGIDLYLPSQVRVTSNHFGSFQQQGIRIHDDTASSFNGVTIASNSFTGDGTSGTHPWDIDYYLQSSGTIGDVAITGNSFVAGSKTTAGINLENGPTNMTIIGNTFSDTTPILYGASITPTSLFVQSNAGYNPIGAVTNFVENTGHTANPATGTATPTSATTYTVRITPMQLIIIGGTVTAIVVNGKTIASAATTEVLELAIGDTFAVTFSAAPTWQATFR